jgi:hypothetical protein
LATELLPFEERRVALADDGGRAEARSGETDEIGFLSAQQGSPSKAAGLRSATPGSRKNDPVFQSAACLFRLATVKCPEIASVLSSLVLGEGAAASGVRTVTLGARPSFSMRR